MRDITELYASRPGSTVQIVGKGPSLAHLRREHFCAGPVIVLNDAITRVAPLRLDDVYSLQNNGEHWPAPGATVIHNAAWRYDAVPDMEWRAEILGLSGPYVPVILVAVAIARLMACYQIRLLCCDVFSTRTAGTVGMAPETPESVGAYLANHPLSDPDARHDAQVFLAEQDYATVIPLLRKNLGAVPYHFVNPEA